MVRGFDRKLVDHRGNGAFEIGPVPLWGDIKRLARTGTPGNSVMFASQTKPGRAVVMDLPAGVS